MLFLTATSLTITNILPGLYYMTHPLRTHVIPTLTTPTMVLSCTIPCTIPCAQIRQHIDHVDNVPLLVSLFTSSTPDTSREMIEIMQVSVW